MVQKLSWRLTLNNSSLSSIRAKPSIFCPFHFIQRILASGLSAPNPIYSHLIYRTSLHQAAFERTQDWVYSYESIMSKRLYYLFNTLLNYSRTFSLSLGFSLTMYSRLLLLQPNTITKFANAY